MKTKINVLQQLEWIELRLLKLREAYHAHEKLSEVLCSFLRRDKVEIQNTSYEIEPDITILRLKQSLEDVKEEVWKLYQHFTPAQKQSKEVVSLEQLLREVKSLYESEMLDLLTPTRALIREDGTSP